MLPWILVGAIGLIAFILALSVQSKQAEITKLQNNVAQSRSFADELQQQMQEGKSSLEAQREENRELRKKQKSQKKKTYQLQQDYDKVAKQLEEAKNDTTGHSEIARLREQVDEVQHLRETVERERNQLEKEYSQKLEDVQSTIGEEKRQLEQDNRQMQRELSSAKRRIDKLEQEIKKERKRVGGEKSLMQRLETRATNNDRAFRVTQNELHRAHRQIRELVETNADLRKRLQELNVEIQNLSDETVNNLGLSDDQLYESSPEEFIESLDAASGKNATAAQAADSSNEETEAAPKEATESTDAPQEESKETKAES
ncbi:MAG: hypothetical protein EP343_21600 [Deltaproteobacteria bacterium]|nr:MAG: hypothetical protein EP343_21600 [Deltaproteobacteria bacterium]